MHMSWIFYWPLFRFAEYCIFWQIIFTSFHHDDKDKFRYSRDLNTGLVWYSNGQKLSDNRMVRYSDHHLNTGHLNREQVKVRYSDVSIIQVFVIQIPTVQGMLQFFNFCSLRHTIRKVRAKHFHDVMIEIENKIWFLHDGGNLLNVPY